MQALAAVLAGQGWRLTGSDLLGGALPSANGSPAALCRGHHLQNVPPGAELVVYSDAVGAGNLELQRAAELGIPTRSYFQMAGELTAGMHCAAVAGTHGKSSTVGMCASIFEQAGADPLVFCGASTLGRASGGRFGRGPVALVEACEFRANFLHLRPKQAVLLGIDHDHFDCYPDKRDLLDAFARFVQSIPRGGLLIARADCPDSREVAANASCRVETFAIMGEADWSAGRLIHRRGLHEFTIFHHSRPVCEVRLRVPGAHNVGNAMAAAALASANGIPSDCIGEALSRFPGLHRRLECLGSFGGVTIIDDYAHHPTEIIAALTTVRQIHPERRLWCVFQPHQALRLARLFDETADSLQLADTVVVADVFRAREGSPAPGEPDARQLAGAVRLRGTPVAGVGSVEVLVPLLAGQLAPGDVLLTLGAGDIRIVAEAIKDEAAISRPWIPDPC
jgi:UDP-N-acetylmuramate--alanine ligase